VKANEGQAESFGREPEISFNDATAASGPANTVWRHSSVDGTEPILCRLELSQTSSDAV